MPGLGKLLFFHDDPHNDISHFYMWNEYLLQVDPNYVIGTSKESIYQQLKEVSNQEIILSQPKNFAKDFPTSIKCFVYSINPVSNVQVIRKFSNKNHIFIGHGDNLKNSTVNKQFRIYDHYFAPGQATIDRFKQKNIEVTKNFFQITGRPQVTKIQPAKNDSNNNRKTVLYRPTFYGASLDKGVNSLENSLEIVKKLVDLNLNIIFKPHPWSITASDNYFYQHDFPLVQATNDFLNEQNSRQISGKISESNFGNIYGPTAYDLDIYQAINQSDFLISDLSYVTVDYLASAKPIVLNSYLDNSQEFIKKIPLSKSLYLLNKDLSNLDEVLNFALNDDYKRKLRIKEKDYYLSKIKNPEQEFVEKLKKFI